MTEPDVTVVVTAYNEERYVDQAVESVLGQTRKPERILVVDAGSTDGTRGIVREYADRHPSVDALLLDDDPNIPEMRNAALSEVSTDLVTFLDGDDRFREEKLERELATYRSDPGAGLVFSNVAYVNEGGNVTGEWCESGTPPTGSVLYENAMRDWPKGSLYRNELVETELLEDVEGYDENLPIYEDWDLKIRLAPMTSVAYCRSTLAEYRRHPGGVSSRSPPRRYVDLIRRIHEKNRELFRRELPPGKRREVETSMRGRIKRYEALANRRDGDRLRAVIAYLQYLRLHPPAARNYKLHLRFLLPESAYEALSRRYGSTNDR